VQVVARGVNAFGEPVTVEGTHLLARAVQHETDHLDGILFVDRLDPEQRREAMRLVRETDWAASAPVVRVSPHPSVFGGH
jgi:peptide deformylase